MSGPRTYLLTALLVWLAISGLAPAAATDASTSRPVLAVDDDGTADYRTIQAAVDAAPPGATVRVRPGTYSETLLVDVSVTVVAPDGATLDGRPLSPDAAGVRIGRSAAPAIEGFTIRGYNTGVVATGSDGAWTLRNTVIRNASWRGVGARGTTGDWRIENVTVVRAGTGIAAGSSTGDWTITGAHIRRVAEGSGIDVTSASGEWVVSDTTIQAVDWAGIAGSYTTGDWQVVDTTVRNATVGISAIEATGNWTISQGLITDVTVSRQYDFWQPPLTEGAAIDAKRTNGSWRIAGTRILDAERVGIIATGAAPAGRLTGDVRLPSTSDGPACEGNVECGRPGSVQTDSLPSEPKVPTDPPRGTTSPASGTTGAVAPETRTTAPSTTESRPDPSPSATGALYGLGSAIPVVGLILYVLFKSR